MELSRERRHRLQRALELGHKLRNGRSGLRRGGAEELPREPQRSPIHQVRWGNGGLISGRRTNPKQHQWKIRHPVGRAGGLGHKSLLKNAMDALHHAIRLWMIRRRPQGLDAEAGHEISPQVGGELAPLIGGNVLRYTIPGDPGTQKGLSTVLSSRRSQRDSLKPAGIPVNDGHKV